MEYSSWWILVDAQFVISISTMVYYTWILILMCNSTSTVFRSAFYRIFIVTVNSKRSQTRDLGVGTVVVCCTEAVGLLGMEKNRAAVPALVYGRLEFAL
ncbi:hypothetical protein Y032_0025g1157 [Ancylostoma ceylanicum]|uniref:Uncharacterized protein n=1 Tax=Ancylostoma ceylanicum TaxID=53326 RepID=A0A016UVS1_9BILA|nr:hypothetical protein Y032_0025g1157 [Ancylostoma ceylanicum]